jgi:DNA-binding NarL/FixJ family response regulator
MIGTKHITVLVAEDTELGRIGLRNMLAAAKNIHIVGETDSVYAVDRLIKELSPDVLLMGLEWYGDYAVGRNRIREIKRENPDLKVIAITAYPNLIADAWKAGADQVVNKNLKLEDLLELVQTVSLRNISFASELRDSHGFQDQLSPRELEVLGLIDRGYSDKEISAALQIQVNTTKNHVKSILQKLNAGNRRKAALIARGQGILR